MGDAGRTGGCTADWAPSPQREPQTPVHSGILTVALAAKHEDSATVQEAQWQLTSPSTVVGLGEISHILGWS